MKVKKLADGGGFATFTPILSNFPSSPVSSNPQKSELQDNSVSSILDEKMIEHLYKQGGLVNDVNQLISELIQLERGSQNPFLSKQNRSSMLKVISKINEINQTKDYWKDAINRAKEAGGLGEIAVSDGRIFVKSKDNKIESLTLQEYSKKRDKLNPLSVQELMYERQYNPSLTEQNSVFTVADNAIGMNKITDHIKSLVSALEYDSSESTEIISKERALEYIKSLSGKTPTSEEMKSLSVLNQVLNNPSNYSKVNIKTQTEKNQINKALNYIWKTLGTPAQEKLLATAVVNGTNNPLDFILDILKTNTYQSTTTSVEPIEDYKAQGQPAPKDEKEPKQVSLTPAELVHKDRLYKPGMSYILNNPNTGIELNMTATGIAPLYSLEKDGGVISSTIVSNIFSKHNYQAILDPNKAYIGDTKVSTASFSEMISSGDDVAKVYMPVNSDGSPDLARLEKFKKLYEEYDSNKDKWNSAQAEYFFSKNDFPGIKIKEYKDDDGTIRKEIIENQVVKPFLAIPILTNSASDISDYPWMYKLTGLERDNAEIILDQAFTVWGGTPSKPVSKDLSPDNFGPEWINPNKPYKGTLFVAYRPESSGIISSIFGHVLGTAPTETDISRNLKNSNNTFTKVSGQASVL